jgi:hypothetical protein
MHGGLHRNNNTTNRRKTALVLRLWQERREGGIVDVSELKQQNVHVVKYLFIEFVKKKKKKKTYTTVAVSDNRR